MRIFYFATALILCIATSNSQNFKSPSEFLGYELGTQFSRHHEVIDYFKYIASQNEEQVVIEQYGETNERRKLFTAILSSAQNIKNLEAIRTQHLASASGLIKNNSHKNIAIVWLSYNVHGNESSSTEAALKTAYELLAFHQNYLQNTVVIIDPCLNPDGRDRYVNWYNETASKPNDTSIYSEEHNETWPGGRPNHYLFDLNRDWVWATQVETTSRLKIYNKWLPHIHVDFHEQGINEPYYFAPAAEPMHEIITDWQRDFQTQIGKNHANYFDQNGWLYFTRERFDLFYPSYGDTYPTFVGSIGMTYEQAGHGIAGLGVINDEGDELTLKERIDHHNTTGISTVEMASKNTKELCDNFKSFFDTSSIVYKSYIMRGKKDHISSLKELLDKHEITYSHGKGDKIAAIEYENINKKTSFQTKVEDLIVSTNQTKGKMVKVLFEPTSKLKDSLTYDITAWNLPYAYNLKTVISKKLIEGINVKQKKINNLKKYNAIAYLSKWNSVKDASFLSDLLKLGIKVRFTEKTMINSGNDFKNGSLIIIKGDNDNFENFHEIIINTANKHQRQLYGLTTGFADMGPDFGSPDIKLIKTPKVALLKTTDANSLSYGSIWHFFEKQLTYPITQISLAKINSKSLSGLNTIIIPDGYYGKILEDSNGKLIKEWVKNGGKIIAIANALDIFANEEEFNLTSIAKNKENIKKSALNTLIPYANREREWVKNMISGVVFKTSVDTTHPLAFGYNKNYYTLKTSTKSYKLLDNGYNVVHLPNSNQAVSGFIGSEVKGKFDYSLVVGEERYGSGSLVYFSDDPLFRSFWEAGKLFIANALFFSNNNSYEL